MPVMLWLASTRWMPYERPLRANSSSRSTDSRASASLPASSTWNSSMTVTMRGSGLSRGRSASLVTPCRLSAVARRCASRRSSRSTARPYSRSDSMPTARACGSQDGSRPVGTNSVKLTPSLKSSRYSCNSAGG
ncbi:hypothetical protein ONO86_04477 [Micromonospora noduli]|nr:hypothetical protein ONO86_04477 [Micromonospora noduli]